MKNKNILTIVKIIVVVAIAGFFIYFTNFAKHTSNNDWRLVIFLALAILAAGAFNSPIIKKRNKK